MSDHDAMGAAYFDEARRSFRGYKRLADQALQQVDDRDFFQSPGAESNSLAQLVKHVAGNMRSRWTDFLTSDGEKPDRNRDQEFIITSSDTREELMRRWEASFSQPTTWGSLRRCWSQWDTTPSRCCAISGPRWLRAAPLSLLAVRGRV